MKTINAAFIGLGNVNKNLLQILDDKKDILAGKYGLVIKPVMVADSSGSAVNLDGFDNLSLIAHKESGKRVSDLDEFKAGSMVDVMMSSNPNLVFEASPVDFKTGGEALDIARAALAKGISVVCANKGPVVKAHDELASLARLNGAGFKFSATVCGGLPVVNIGQRDLIAGDITKVSGIFNGTCNFMLDALKNGMSFDDAVKEAQYVGAAEADPALDID
ncbi:MAG: hypothetical protein P8I94_00135, partial [Emcibacteraceae bacterium]|nr:hypothetical protein [Emcibacteraceae bacterium]